ncbi:MAG: hypothetical protein Q8R42_07115 [Desulfocapsaceae bacterium]|nr:hypothetical protein [Desulfocapsaceae bacterium]
MRWQTPATGVLAAGRFRRGMRGRPLRAALLLTLPLLGAGVPPLGAEESISVSGRLSSRATLALDDSSSKEDPSLTGRLVIDARESSWRLYTWLEGGWDGAVANQNSDHTILKDLGTVYQDNSPYLEAKELYAERALAGIETKVGIQRFSWGRLDEYPINDLFNPWDYRQFLVKSLEERKIGVPAVSATMSRSDWSGQFVWVPWLVPYRLPGPDERWSLFPATSAPPETSGPAFMPLEPDLPARTLKNGSAGLRWQTLGEIEWAVNLFHGFDPRPVFGATAINSPGTDHGLDTTFGIVPSFHKITSIGLDTAMVTGDWSLRAETAYACNRAFTVRRELWETSLSQGADPSLSPSLEVTRDTLDYGVAADYRPFEDGLLTIQAQQSVILDRPDTLYDQTVESILWANLKIGWLNQKVDTSLNLAWNPEHGATMIKAGTYYVLTDFWKVGLTGLLLDGPPQSIFGRYAMNDQVMLEVVYSW